MRRAQVLASQQSTATREDRDAGAIVVFGSCFLDYVAYVEAIPKPGQTLGSESFAKGFGGKGANQAVMAAKLGAKVRMAACVGADGDGADYIANFKRQGVDTRYVTQVKGQATGLAMITVNVKTAQNAIVICPNAAGKTSPAHLPKAALDGAKILVCQHEIPLEATLAALKAAHKRDVYTIFNTAPAPSAAEVEIIKPALKYVSLICPNEHEAKLMTGIDVVDFDSAVKASRAIQELGCRDVVITLGSQGACVVPAADAGEPIHVTGLSVQAVDTTGAGDCYVGSMAHFLCCGESLVDACRKANVCAARSVTRRGTQASYPSRKELPASLFEKA